MLSPLALKSACSGLHRSRFLFVPPSPIPFLSPGARAGGALHGPTSHSCCDKMAEVTSPSLSITSEVLAVPVGAVGGSVWDVACPLLKCRRRMEGESKDWDLAVTQW